MYNKKLGQGMSIKKSEEKFNALHVKEYFQEQQHICNSTNIQITVYKQNPMKGINQNKIFKKFGSRQKKMENGKKEK